jgi:predicted AlkP superfamily phosphohydrolase/phosphomutase/Tfp pilus assembly protein PilF
MPIEPASSTVAFPDRHPSASSDDAGPLPKITGRVLLVGWDAADWKIISPLLDRGEMPHLEGLINRGAMGDLLTLRPILSPMLWNSIATGQRPDRHGVHGFTEVDAATNTVRSVSSTTRRCKALWNMVTQAGGRAHAVNWYASHPAEPIQGICISDVLANRLDNMPLTAEVVHPASLLDEFSALRMLPEEIEYECLKLFVPRIAEVNQEKDQTLARLARLLAESFTVHNAATRVLEDEPWDLAAVYYPGLDHFCHGFINFHPPQLPGVSDEAFGLYSQVVSGAYRLHDLFLGRLLALAGPETHVILLSDHGFHSDHLRPLRIPAEPVGPAIQHRPHGIVVLAGDRIKADERIYGAGLLDIAPTVLTLLGLPVGADMPGRVMVDAFVEPPAAQAIPSWESIAGEDGRHPPGYVASSQNQGLLLEQFAALGYLDLKEIQGNRGPDACRRENDWSLAQSLLQMGAYERGADLLIDLCERWPERGDFAILLAETLRRLGLAKEARRLIEALVLLNPTAAPARYLLGVCSLEERHYAEAVAQLEAIGPDYADRADLHVRLGMAYLRMGKRTDAEAAFRRANELDPHDSEAWLGLARCAMRGREWAAAESAALEAVGLEFHKPVAHALIGLARMRLNQPDDAGMALNVACRQAPKWLYPRRLRLFLWRDRDGQQAASALADLRTLARGKRSYRRDQSEFATAGRLAALDRLNEQYRQLAGAAAKQAEATADEPAPLELVVVSGLPRSGTSLMMQMLQAAGVPILCDGERAADADNPAGYLEWEAIKRIPSQPELMRQAAGKAIKVVSPLVPHLPRTHRYRIIFVDRPIEEVLQSQGKMREHRAAAHSPDEARLSKVMAAHRGAILALLQNSPNVQLLVVPYPDLIANPSRWTAAVSEFLGSRAPAPEQMANVIRPELYRNRSHANVSVQQEELK